MNTHAPDIVIVGLGNPGEQYESTRHNIGFQVLNTLNNGEPWSRSKSTNALCAWTTIGGRRVELIKPQGFYNATGAVIGHVVKKYGLTPEQIIIIHDDVDLNLGDVRKVFGRGSGGNKGVESIISALKSKDFTRIRIGIIPQNWLGNFKKPAKHKIPDFVLKPFSKKEQKELPQIFTAVVELLTE